jgi:hypothetical protein
MMPEAEVSLRLAFYLMAKRLTSSPVRVAIDGAQIQTGQKVHFAIKAFLADGNCVACGPYESWRGTFHHNPSGLDLVIHSKPGCSDIVAVLNDGRTLHVESKKGPLTRSRNSQEYALLHEALGQVLTIAEIGTRDLLAVAVPHSQRFVELAARWRNAPLICKTQIRILTVGRDNEVHGF